MAFYVDHREAIASAGTDAGKFTDLINSYLNATGGKAHNAPTPPQTSNTNPSISIKENDVHPTAPSAPSTPAVEVKTFLHGNESSTVSDEAIYNMISTKEAEIAKLAAIQHKPEPLKAKIAALNDEIDALVKFCNERHAKNNPAPAKAATKK